MIELFESLTTQQPPQSHFPPFCQQVVCISLSSSSQSDAADESEPYVGGGEAEEVQAWEVEHAGKVVSVAEEEEEEVKGHKNTTEVSNNSLNMPEHSSNDANY